MLFALRNDIQRNMNRQTKNDLLIESVDFSNIQQQFIDEDEINENDPELQKLIALIPESEEDLDEKELDDLVESFTDAMGGQF